ncbi:MAG: TAXI family TRAP transporter solute-binding subunit [Firmicutes bacterium]|nr:TAXI family TRAP transporter solute-binding subunit [Bacillota bacterium]
MKKLLVVFLALMLVFCFAACGGGADGGDEGGDGGDGGEAAVVDNDLRFVTGGESGTYYAFGSVIAQHATNNAGVKIVGLVGNGSQGNVMEMEDGNAELAFCQSDVMAYAYEGTNLFADTGAIDCFSTVAALYTEQVQVVTLDPDIKTIADLAGKNVSIGSAGSGVYFNALDLLGAYGLTEDDITPTYQSFGDSADSLKNGQIDAAFIVAGAPTTAVTDLAATKSVYLVGLDDEHVDQLLAASPYYTKCVIPADVYGLPEDVTTVGVAAVILARDNVSEDAIYALTADIFDNAPDLVSSHAKYAEIDKEFGASITSVPYHPGAAKYFAEQGFTVPTK